MKRTPPWLSDLLKSASRPHFRQRPGHFFSSPPRPKDVATETSLVTGQSLLRERRTSPAVALLEAEETINAALAVTSDRSSSALASADSSASADVVAQPRGEAAVAASEQKSPGAKDDDDDDVFIHEDESLLAVDSAGAVNAVPKDINDLVTEEFKSMRQREVIRRRKILFELMNPNPEHYTYAGKPVPVPPISFGVLSPEAHLLGRTMFTERPYSLVRQSPSTDYFFEIKDLYLEIAFVGRANAGKSSLINALVGHRVAKTSSIPNSTRTVNFYQNATPEEINRFTQGNPNKLVKLPAGGKQFTLVDIPGFGIEGMSDKWRDNAIQLTDSYLGLRRSLNTLFMCVDATKGLTPTDITYFEWLKGLHGIMYVVVTKCDAVPHAHLCNVMRKIYQTITERRRKHRNIYPFVLPVSAETGENIDALRALIVETSGVIPGSKLREILRKRSHEGLAKIAEQERQRLLRNQREEQGLLDEPSQAQGGDAVSAPLQHQPSFGPVTVTLDSGVETTSVVSTYGGKFKTNVGVQREITIGGDNSNEADGGSEQGLNNSTVKMAAAAFRTPNRTPRRLPRSRDDDSQKVNRRGVPSVLVEQPDGSFVGTSNGEAIVATKVTHRHDGTFKVHGAKAVTPQQAAALVTAKRAAPSAAWARPQSTNKKEDLTARARDAYTKANGGTGMSEERFWDEVDAATIDRDGRWAVNMRQSKGLEYNNGSRVSWANLPKGTFRKYGKAGQGDNAAATGKPSRVLGL